MDGPPQTAMQLLLKIDPVELLKYLFVVPGEQNQESIYIFFVFTTSNFRVLKIFI